MSESKLTEDLISKIEHDFVIKREVSGLHSLYEQNVRIDLLLKAKPHLIACGFTDKWFGVECKWSDRINGATSKVTRMVWQSITYAQSHFRVSSEENIIPEFVAVYTPSDLPRPIETHLNTLLALGLYGNVGRIYLYNNSSWGIKFASIYARSGTTNYSLNKSQLPKRRAGSV